MARAPMSARPGSGSSRRITISTPEAGSNVNINSAAGRSFVLDFDPSATTVTYDRAGTNLQLLFENGGSVTLLNYFAVGSRPLPNFELSDGSVVSGNDFLTANASDLDLTTASGPRPAAAPPRGSGVGEYRGELGNLIDGVERLGMLGTGLLDWSNATPLWDYQYESTYSTFFLGTIGGGPGGPTVYESGLPNGSNPGDGVDTGWHTFDLDPGYQIVGLTEGGTTTIYGKYGTLTITQVGPNSYQYKYELTSPHYSGKGDDGPDVIEVDAEIITVPVTDGRNTGSLEIAIDIGDDTPDGVSMEKGEEPVYSGYELTGDWDVKTYGADGPGGLLIKVVLLDEEGETISKENIFEVPIGTATKISVDGKPYGTIEFKDDGTYVFIPAPNTEAILGIALGARDGDGDIVWHDGGAGLTFDVTKPPIKSIVLGDKEDEWFSEAHLEEGTLPNEAQLTKEIALPDGYTVDTSGDEWTENKDGSFTLKTDYGTLTYYPPVGADGDTSYQPPRLTYTLDEAAAHGDKDVFYDTSAGKITLKDPKGNSYEADTKFQIRDDQPVVTFSAGDEDPVDVKSGQDLNGTWSSVFGADGPADEDSLFITVKVDGKEQDFPVTVGKEIPLEIDGKNYGSIVFQDDGDFIYTPAPNLKAELEISLSATDGEGDTVTAKDGNIKINVTPPVGPGALFPKDDSPVSESNLPGGTDPDPDGLVKEIEIPDGYYVDPTGPGWVKNPDTGNYEKKNDDGSGKLVYNPDDNTLIYELEEPHDHNKPGRDIEDEIFDDIVLKDKDGNTFEDVEIKVPLEDDVPKVNVEFDSNTVDEDGSLGGNLEYDFGADGEHPDNPLEIIVTGPDGEKITIPVKNEEGEQRFPVVIDGEDYGEIVVDLTPDKDGGKGTGEFEFIPNPDKGGSDLEFEFGARDKDGDLETTPGDVISIIDPTGPGINFLETDSPLNEAYLPGGTGGDNSAELTKELNLPDGYTVDTSKNGWVQDPATGGWKLEGSGHYGYLSCDANGSNLTYTLTDRAEHTGAGRDTLKDVFDKITIKDSDGKEYELPAKITVADDEPVVNLGGGTSGNSIGSGQSYEGTWDVNFGADGEKTGGGLVLEVTVGGKSAPIAITPGTPAKVIVDGVDYGTITFDQSTGKYTFDAPANSNGSLKFVLTATDSEGDTVRSGDGFTITVTGPEGPGDKLTGNGDPIKESYLPGGTEEGDGSLTQVIDLPEDYVVDTSTGGWVEQPDGTWKLDRPDNPGHLTWDPDEKELTYTLDEALDHENPGRDIGTDVIPDITIKDKDGNTFEVDVEVKLEDDAPQLTLDGNKTVESGDSVTGKWDVDFGADGPAADDSITVTIKHPSTQESMEESFDKGDLPKTIDVIIDGVNYGELTFDKDGNYTFDAKPDLSGERLDLVVSGKDGDGDVSVSDPIVIGIVEPNGPGISHLTTSDGSPFDEANFPQGTSPDSSALIKYLNLPKDYTIDVTQGEWVQELGSDRWILYTEEIRGDNGQLINGFGKLIYDAKANTLSYQLTGLVFNGPDSDMGVDTAKDIILKDKNGNTFELDMIVDIKDDKPQLDFAGQQNVSSGRDFEGEWSCMFGADGALEKDSGNGPIAITVTDADGKTETIPLAMGSIGEIAVGGVVYGKITLNADGTFFFQAEPNVTGELSLSMTISDRDGDSVTSDAPFKIKIEKPGPGDDMKIGGGDDEWFSESYLKGGTEESATGSFVVRELTLPKNSAGDLCTPDVTDWTRQSDGVYIKKGSYGYLTWNETTGKLTYTLERTATHSDPAKHGADDILQEQIKVTVKDKYGNTYTVGSEIEIRDDAPDFTFKLDQQSVESGAELTGDLGLKFGADGAATGGKALEVKITVEINGQEVSFTLPLTAGSSTTLVHNGVNYGTLTLNKDYTFSYKASPNLHETTSELNVNFVATDKDGDRVWASGDDGTKITIDEPKVIPPSVFGKEQWFSESNLPEGTANDTNALTKPIAIPNGFTIDTGNGSGWTKVGGASSDIYEKKGANGTLTYNKGDNTLTYTLTDPANHPDTNKSGPDDVINDELSVIFKDNNNNTFSSTAEIAIRDDAPKTEFHASTGDTEADDYSILSGKVGAGTIEVQGGADGVSTITIGLANGTQLDVTKATAQNPLEISGQGGTLKVWNENGTLKYEYTAKGNSELNANKVTDKFTVTVTDKDGDSASDNLTMNVTKDTKTDIEIDKASGGAHADEAGLADGSNAGTGHVSEWKEITLPTGVKSIQTGTFESAGADGKADGYGTFEIKYENGKYYYNFTLKNPYQHSAQGREEALNATQSKVTVTYDDGNTGDAILYGTIKDDMPSVEYKASQGDKPADDYNVNSGGVNSGTISVIEGADGLKSISINGTDVSAGTAAKPVVINGAGGKLEVWTVNGVLQYKYTAKRNTELTDNTTKDQFTVTVTDNDGDVVTDALTLTVNKSKVDDFTPDDSTGGAHVAEAGLPDGTAPTSGTHTVDWIEITLPDSLQSIALADSSGKGHYGTFELKFEGGKYYYKYTLDKAYDHSGLPETALSADKVALVTTDKAGNTGGGSLVASIKDDAPELEVKGDVNDTPTDDYTVSSGTASTGVFEIEGGADGLASVVITYGTAKHTVPLDGSSVKIDGTGGTLTVWKDGDTIKYSYQAKPNDQITGTPKDSFTVTVTDTDGDSASAPVSMTVKETTPPTIEPGTVDGKYAQGDEAGLANGSNPNGGGDVSEWKEIVLPNGVAALDVGTVGGTYGDFTIRLNNGKYEYRYKLNDAYKHSTQGALVQEKADTITIKYTDTAGNKGNAVFYADIKDDMPSLEIKGAVGDTTDDNYNVATSAKSTGIFELTEGADRLGKLTVNGTEIAKTADSASKAVTVNGTGGSLKVWYDKTTGNFRYEYTAKDRSDFKGQDITNIRDQFAVLVTDGDGDTISANMSMKVDVENTAPVTEEISGVIEEDNTREFKGNIFDSVTDADGDSLEITNLGSHKTTYGTITIHADGTYEYKVDDSNPDVRDFFNGTQDAPLRDSFEYTVSDGYGGTVKGVINLDLKNAQLKVSEPTTDPDKNEVTGGHGNDVIVGDAIGAGTESANTHIAYNIAIVVDNSQSMITGKYMASVQKALTELVELLCTQGDDQYTHINLSFISFGSTSNKLYDVQNLTSSDLTNLLDAIASISTHAGGTNYESAFRLAGLWFSEQDVTGDFEGKTVTYENMMYFLTDGVPTEAIADSWKYIERDPNDKSIIIFEAPEIDLTNWTLGMPERIVGNPGEAQSKLDGQGILWTKAPGDTDWTERSSIFKQSQPADYTPAENAAKEVFKELEDNYNVSSHGVGINLPYQDQKDTLNKFDNTGDSAAFFDITDPDWEEKLAKELGEYGQIGWQHEDSKNTAIDAGGGYNIVFGDALTADWIFNEPNRDGTGTWDGKNYDGKALVAKQSFAIIKAYVMHINNITNPDDETLDDLMRRYIEANIFKFGQSETDRGNNDTITGSDGGNIIFGQKGDDEITGGVSNDLLVGGAGNDTLTGGGGADIFLFHPGEGDDSITDFNSDQGDIIVKVGSGTFGNIAGSSGAAERTVADILQGHDETASNGANYLLVGSGFNSNKIKVDGVEYDNRLTGGDGDDVIFGGSGNNLLIGGDGNDHIIGGPGNDRIEGGSGNDFIHGGLGNDIIFGGSGDNVLFGGGGADTFAWKSDSSGGKDQIMDFSTADKDKLGFADLLDSGETLESFLDSSVNGLSIDTVNNIINFTITDGSFSKDVEVHFDAGDTQFSSVVSEYNSTSETVAQQEILSNFLLSISTN